MFTISALTSLFRQTPINEVGSGENTVILVVVNIAMVSIAEIKNEMTIKDPDINKHDVRMNNTVVLGMVFVSSPCKRRCLGLKTLLSSGIRVLPSMRVLKSITGVLGSKNDVVAAGVH